MRERIVISFCILVLMSCTSYAQDAGQACMDQLAKTESLVDQKFEAKALDEGEVEDVNMLLDEVDAFCTEGKYKEAKKALADVNKVLTPKAQPEAAPE